MEDQKTSTPIFFILGRGRSGTTLLKCLLNSHPNILVPAESRFVQYLYYRFGKAQNWNEQKINHFYNEISNCIEPININDNELKKQLSQHNSNTQFSNLCKLVYLNIKDDPKKIRIKLIGDKNPRYSFFIETLIKIFPEAKFIHLTRDYRDNILSFLNIRNIKIDSKNIVALSEKWKYYNKEIEKQKSKQPEKFIHLSYEDLVKEPKTQLKKICEFLSIDYDANMINFYKKIKESDFHNNPFMANMHKNLLSPISSKLVGRWRDEMKAKDIIKAELVSGIFAKQYRYKMITTKIPFFLKLYCFPRRIICGTSLSIKNWFYRYPCIMNTYYYFYKKSHK